MSIINIAIVIMAAFFIPYNIYMVSSPDCCRTDIAALICWCIILCLNLLTMAIRLKNHKNKK